MPVLLTDFFSQNFKEHFEIFAISLFVTDILKVLYANVSWNFGCLFLVWDVCHLKTGSRHNDESETSFPNNGDFLQELIQL